MTAEFPLQHTPVPPGLSLETDRLRLRLLDADDRDEFVRVHTVSAELFDPWHPRIEPRPTHHQFFDRLLARTRRGAEAGTDCRLVGEALDDRRIVGFFNLNEIVRGFFQNAYAGWAVAAPDNNRGFATEGIRGLLDLAFAPPPRGLGLHRVQANVMPENAASQRVAEKIGFRREGDAKQYLRIAGRWADHTLFAKIADEHTPVYLSQD